MEDIRDIEKDESGINVLRKQTTPRYSGIVSKFSIWIIFVVSHIVSRKYIIKKCGGEDNAVSLGRAIPDDPDILERKKWFILYWLGPFADVLLTVLSIYILSSEKAILAEYSILTIKIMKGFYDTISTSSFAKLLKKSILKFREYSKPKILLIGSYVTQRNVMIAGFIYVIVRVAFIFTF